MHIVGMQKLTLLDYPEHVACTIFTPGCNFRCPWCHNLTIAKDAVSSGNINEDDVMEYLEHRKNVLDGVVVTGGEPTLQSDLPEFVARIKECGFKVKLDTNGTNPNMLESMIHNGLVDYVAMDIKNSIDSYGMTAGIDVNNIIGSIQRSMSVLINGTVDYEFRTTVVNEFHTEASFEAMAKLIAGAKRFFLQAYKHNGDPSLPTFHTPSIEQLNRYADIMRSTIQHVEIRGIDQ